MTTDFATRWRPRWYHWTAASLMLLVLVPLVAALAWRVDGFRRYDAVIAEQRALGMATTLDEFIASAPAVDRARQARWKAWMERGVRLGVDSVHVDQGAFDDWATGAACGPPAKVLGDLAKIEPHLADGSALLREGPAVLTGFGWMQEHFAGGRRDLIHAAAMPLPNLLTCRLAASGYALSALTAEDPTADLDALDALVTDFAPSATPIDAMIRIALDAIRDEAYLRLAVLHRLDEGRATRWMAESPIGLAAVADALRGERLLSTATLIADERVTTYAMSEWVGGVGPRAMWYVFTGHDGAIAARLEAHAEERLRHLRPDAPNWQDAYDRMRGAGRVVIPNIGEMATTAWENDTAHRIKRLAGRIILAGAPLPADHAAFAARYADDAQVAGGPDRATLIYERLSDHRFRLGLDPATPVPDFADPKRIAARAMLGKPSKSVGKPSHLPVLDIGAAHVEADVAALRP